MLLVVRNSLQHRYEAKKTELKMKRVFIVNFKMNGIAKKYGFGLKNEKMKQTHYLQFKYKFKSFYLQIKLDLHKI